MGNYSPDIRNIYHCGPSSCPEYLLETVKTGSDGLQSQGVHMYGKTGQSVTQEMKKILFCTICTQVLFQGFIFFIINMNVLNHHVMFVHLCICMRMC